MDSLPDAARNAFLRALEEPSEGTGGVGQQRAEQEPTVGSLTTPTGGWDERAGEKPKEKRKVASATDKFSCAEDKLAFRMAQGFFEVLDLETVRDDTPQDNPHCTQAVSC